MALSYSSNYIQELIQAGADAQSNLYMIEITGGDLEDTQALTIRASSFQNPDFKQAAPYTVRYVNAYIDRPKAKVEVTRSFDIEFRLDSQYKVYKELQREKEKLFNPEESYTATDILSRKNDNKLLTIKVSVLSSQDASTTIPLFEFDYCWINSITPPSYSTENSNASTVKATFNFLQMKDMNAGI